MPSDNGVTKSRSGGMSVSLAGPDGRILGGGLAGMLVAAGPVQVRNAVCDNILVLEKTCHVCSMSEEWSNRQCSLAFLHHISCIEFPVIFV